MDINWELVGHIKASKYRGKILLELLRKQQIPKELAESTGINLTHVSRTLKQLEQKKVVVCLTPKRIRGKIYAITTQGKTIAKNL